MKRTAAVAAATFISLAVATTPAWAGDPLGGPDRRGCDVGQTVAPPLPPATPEVPPPPPVPAIDVPPPTTHPQPIHTAAPPPPAAVEAPEPTRARSQRSTEADRPEPPSRDADPAPVEDDEPDQDSADDDAVTADVEPAAFVSDLGRPEPCGRNGRDHDGHDHDGRDRDHHGRGDWPSWQIDWPSWDDHPVFVNCAHARAVGAAPIHVGEPGYRLGLDSDRDGIACETGSERHHHSDGDDNGDDGDDGDDNDNGDDNDGGSDSSDSGDDGDDSSSSTVSVSDHTYTGSIPVPVGGVATGGGPANR